MCEPISIEEGNIDRVADMDHDASFSALSGDKKRPKPKLIDET